jgi:hypothetical protein
VRLKSEQNTVARNLKRVPQFLRERPEFTPGQVRWWIFHASGNGMADHGVVVRIGRAVWIDVDAFDRWVEAQNPGLQPAERNAQAGAR